MVFKNFRFQIILRVLILTFAIILLAWCLVLELYLRSAYLVVAVIIVVIEFIWYNDRFNRDIKMFMITLSQRDFTTHYQATGKGKTFDELYEVLNKISEAFKTISVEKEIQYRYLAMLVEHVRVSILSIDAQGRIHLANQAVKALLQKDVLVNLRSLGTIDEAFVNTLQEIRTGETRLIKLRIKNELLQLSIHASEFKLDDRYYKLISMQDIRNELDAKEMEAWQKLIQVLSHEIMNSVAPIISLSETLHGLVRQNAIVQDGEHNALDKGLEAIKIRSEGLYNFTQSYRKLTGIPKLGLKKTSIKDLLNRVGILMQPTIDENKIQFSVTGVEGDVMVDPDLMEHVLINLILNAVEAVKEKENATIILKSSFNAKGKNCVHVIDNGEGMDEATAEKIFIPFFTTRKNGSGIGLAITKQILQLHDADILFVSAKGEGTEFTIVI